MRFPPASSGHSQHLRHVLHNARKEQGLSAQVVADRIAVAMGKPSFSGQSVLYYEAFTRHPPIDVFACWARVLGFRLIVDLDSAHKDRAPVLIEHSDVAEIARALDNASDSVRAAVLTVVRHMVR